MSVYRQLNEEKPRVLLLQMTLNTFFYENGNVFISRLYFTPIKYLWALCNIFKEKLIILTCIC